MSRPVSCVGVTCPVCKVVQKEVGPGEPGRVNVFVQAQCPICLEEASPLVAFTACGHCFCEEDFQRIIDESKEQTAQPLRAQRMRRIIRAQRPPVYVGGQIGPSVSFASPVRPAQASPPCFPRGAYNPTVPVSGGAAFPSFGSVVVPPSTHHHPVPRTLAPIPAAPSQANVPMFMATPIPSSRASPPPALSIYQRSGVVPAESLRQRMAEPKRRKLLHVQGFSTGSDNGAKTAVPRTRKASEHDASGCGERRKRGRASIHSMNKAPWSP